MSQSNPIKFGAVGLSTTGWASSALIPPLLSPPLSSKYTLTALSTTSASSSSAAAGKYSTDDRPVTAYHGSTDQIAADANVKLVIVAVKTPAHSAAAMPVIERGRDVFVEWPLGNGLLEARSLADAAKEKNVRTMVGLQSWQSPVVKKVRSV